MRRVSGWSAAMCLMMTMLGCGGSIKSQNDPGAQPIGAAPACISPKKGVGHWAHDMASVVDNFCRWFYNWGPAPKTGERALRVEFVPMLWSGYFVTSGHLTRLSSRQYPALLTFNEPDSGGQANMTVAAAINFWPQ